MDKTLQNTAIGRKMTQEEYVMNTGYQCPSCGSFDIESDGDNESDNGLVWKKTKCNECGFKYSESYSLVGYENRS